MDSMRLKRHIPYVPDLIVLDLSMPQMNGLETARILRANAVPVPIILFTMYAEELRPQDATEAGIDAVVAKEDLTVLHHQIEKLLVISPHRTLT
jgi:CheY-like chemotaxis protein